MKLRDALFITINQFKLTGKALSRDSGLTENQVSEFRTGKRDMELKNVERLIGALPPDAYHYFWCQLALDQLDNKQLYQLITRAASQMSERESNEQRVLVLK